MALVKGGRQVADEADLLHYVGEAPEGPWAIFSEPGGTGHRLVSVIFPRTLWMMITRGDPFSSEVRLLEDLGRKAIDRCLQDGCLPPTIWATPELLDLDPATEGDWRPPWETLSICGQCHQQVPSGEVLEGIKNALPPNTRGDTEVLVLCPVCQRQTPFVMSPFGVRPI